MSLSKQRWLNECCELRSLTRKITHRINTMKEKLGDSQKNFELSVQLVKSLPKKGSFQPSYSEAGKIYSYFKQAKFGPCTQSRPGFWDVVNRAKWDAWSALGNMPQEVAMKHYVEEIKEVYSRIKLLDEFEEREEEFAGVLIPFCEAVGLPLSTKLARIAKAKETVQRTSSINGTPIKGTPINGTVTNGTPENKTPGNRTPVNGTLDSSGSAHSLLLEQINNSAPKVVSFHDEETAKNTTDTENLSGSEDEVYCDSIDPDQVPSSPSAANGQSFSIETPIKESILQNTSTPYSRNQNSSSNELKTSTSSESKSDFEVVTGNPREGTEFQSIPKKDFEKRESSSDSPKNFNLLDELQKPCPNKSYKQEDARKRYTTKETSRMRHAGVRSHKRQGHTPNQPSSQGGSKRTQEANAPVNSGNDTSSHHSSQYHRCTGHRQSSNSNNSGSDDDSCSTLSSSSSDNVGLKIVRALERMEDNLHDVLERLDSIEGTMKTLTKPATPWWRNYIPSNSVIFWTTWPLLVNLICFYVWRKRRRRHIQKC